ncbi:MAG: TAXI family TRAP transporter solute-binding subunit [Rhodospirillaceae bacterium]
MMPWSKGQTCSRGPAQPNPVKPFFAVSALVRLMALGLVVLVLASLSPPVQAQELLFKNIGTGRTSGAYFPVGGTIANIISNPPGSRACEDGGSCGVPGLIVVAQSTSGSVDNIRRMRLDRLDLAIVQADVAYGAVNPEDSVMGAANMANGPPPYPDLRALSALYEESLHLVTLQSSGIRSLEDLAGLRVSLGEAGSGTLVTSTLVLEAAGLGEMDFQDYPMTPSEATDALVAGALDAFFFFGGAPVQLISHLADTTPISLVPIPEAIADRVNRQAPYLTPGLIRAGRYGNERAVPTVAVSALLVTRASLPDALAEEMTAALWHPSSAAILAKGPPQTRDLDIKRGVLGIPIPIHPGAITYYQKVGLFPSTDGDVLSTPE